MTGTPEKKIAPLNMAQTTPGIQFTLELTIP